ncbi:MAG: hypothetical protein U0325_02180 [Polyangiales bacterium]
MWRSPRAAEPDREGLGRGVAREAQEAQRLHLPRGHGVVVEGVEREARRVVAVLRPGVVLVVGAHDDGRRVRLEVVERVGEVGGDGLHRAAREQRDVAQAQVAELQARGHAPGGREVVARVQARALEHLERAAEPVPVDRRRPFAPEQHLDEEPPTVEHRDRGITEARLEVVLGGQLVSLQHPAQHVGPAHLGVQRAGAQRLGREGREDPLVVVGGAPLRLNRGAHLGERAHQSSPPAKPSGT